MADGEDIGHPEPAAHAGAVCVILRGRAVGGAGADLIQLLNELAGWVRADEPGCDSYVVTREVGAPDRFAVHARFADWAAFNAHAETAHLNSILPRVTARLASPISMEIFLEV